MIAAIGESAFDNRTCARPNGRSTKTPAVSTLRGIRESAFNNFNWSAHPDGRLPKRQTTVAMSTLRLLRCINCVPSNGADRRLASHQCVNVALTLIGYCCHLRRWCCCDAAQGHVVVASPLAAVCVGHVCCCRAAGRRRMWRCRNAYFSANGAKRRKGDVVDDFRWSFPSVHHHRAEQRTRLIFSAALSLCLRSSCASNDRLCADAFSTAGRTLRGTLTLRRRRFGAACCWCCCCCGAGCCLTGTVCRIEKRSFSDSLVALLTWILLTDCIVGGDCCHVCPRKFERCSVLFRFLCDLCDSQLAVFNASAWLLLPPVCECI